MIQWLPRAVFMEAAKKEPDTHGVPPRVMEFTMRLQDIRGRIPDVAPEFTPVEDGDFPGPVERWYGKVDIHLFTMTYHYGSPNPHLVEVLYYPADEAGRAIGFALEQWRRSNPW